MTEPDAMNSHVAALGIDIQCTRCGNWLDQDYTCPYCDARPR